MAQSSVYCTTSSETGTFIEWLPGSNLPNVNPSCQGAFYCRQATLAAQALEILPTGCDPNTTSCTVRVRVPVTMEGLHQEGLLFAPAQIYWFNNPTPTVPCIPPGLPGASCDPPPISTCGLFGAGIDEDQGEATIQLSNVRCDDLDQSRFRQYSFSVYRCKGTSGCETRSDSPTIDLSAASLRSRLGCPEPPKKRCPKDKGAAQCSMCLSAGGGGGGPPGGAGDGPGGGPAGGAGPGGGGGGGGGIGGGGSGWGGGPGGPTGPGARLYYAAGGAGHPGWPGTAEWLPNLGRYWSHDYAQRIVPDPGATPPESHVWLITPWATFREFSNLSGGVYLTNSPSDEYRTLRKVTGGWTLTGLDGTVTTFDADGRWTSTEDRFGNPKQGFYNVLNQLERVTFADQREELFTYDAGTEKLETITEVGVGGSPTRTWTYTWDGDDLERIDLPDGRAWEFFYEDLRFPGYLTRVELVGTEGGREVDVAWEYDALGNVMALWSGDASKTGPDAVGLWQLAFDDPANPTVTTVTDPLGAISTYTLGRDDNSRNPRLEELSGSCPSCSVGPNSTLAYDDPDHPLLPTRETNARGIHTDFTYDDHGQVLTRTEATATALERTTSWTYHPDYPALVTEVEQPSVAGGASVRTTTLVFNAEGALEERRMEGHEEPVGAFSYSTLYTPTQEGLPEVIDPPGFGMGDLTTYVYDAGRGSLVPESRTDPLVGTTTYDYDGYNRRTTVTDPNGVITIMVYDVGDRVTFVTREGATPAENLVTENRYDEFGRLFQTILPKGNVIEYGHDAAGRLISIERKPDDQLGSHGEWVFYDLDAAGNRTREEHQRWDGAGWVTRSFTDYEWQNRCQMQAVVHADGSRTEHAYDCEGNLSEVWDANHPSMMQTEVPTTLYAYDELDRLDTVTQRWGGAGGGFTTTSYGYDVQDHLTGITDGEGNLTTYVYSDRDLMTEEVSPVSGTTTYRYSERGELTETTDARGIVTARVPDELDRVTLVDYPDDFLDISYTYDDPLVPFSKGRLTAITRDGQAMEYRYDRFGRILQDGALSYLYDNNGNRREIGYPGSVTAAYTHDYADRPESLTVLQAGEPDLSIAAGAQYEPAGPLVSLDLGNGLTEGRPYTDRYFPSAITVAPTTPLVGTPVLQWTYTTDNVGNIEGIQDVLTPANDKDYGYQDFQYFLTSGTGPWGSLAWTYDEIGNRLTETRDGMQDVYAYVQNSGMGNTALLDTITLASMGTKTYTYGPAGHLEQVTAPANAITLHSDAAGRLARLERPAGDAASDFHYDGRSFLTSARADSLSEIFTDGFEAGDGSCWTSSTGSDIGAGTADCSTDPNLTSVYSSEGLLHAVTHFNGPVEQSTRYYLYFAGRPVAQLDLPLGGSAEVTWLSVDHLGTPVLATDQAGVVLWEGGFEPFGVDYSGASGAGVDLRLPGQWEDGVWEEAGEGSEVTYNLYRWHLSGQGRYSASDPLGLLGGLNGFAYGATNPLLFVDRLGLAPIPPDGKCCDERPDFALCDCDPKQVETQLSETVSLRSDFCERKGASHATRTEDVMSAFAPAGGIDGKRPWFDPSVIGDDPCIAECVCVHEKNHQKMLSDPRVTRMIIDKEPDDKILDYLECVAYGDEAECLKRYLPR